jgi:hypothetical protein
MLIRLLCPPHAKHSSLPSQNPQDPPPTERSPLHGCDKANLPFGYAEQPEPATGINGLLTQPTGEPTLQRLHPAEESILDGRLSEDEDW